MPPYRRHIHSARQYATAILRNESIGGYLLLAAGALAVLCANSPWAGDYFSLREQPISIGFAAARLKLSALHWVNDALMAGFFLLVGLELKREWLDGAFADPKRRILPLAAALGGMVAPALIYLLVTGGNPAALRGWAIPSATDIAFSLGILGLLGSRAPISLKLMLTAIAVIDDLGAIMVIAIFYTDHVAPDALLAAAACMAGLCLLNLCGVRRLWPYLVLGAILWLFVLRSGIHPTLAGVALALAIPFRLRGAGDSLLLRLEHRLQPWVTFGIVPLFAFMNAGLPLGGLSLADLLAPVPLGIALGLFLGKQIGVLGAIVILVWLRVAMLPADIGWRQLHGVALLCGIGFTMSLFIGSLAFPSGAQLDAVRLGILTGSLASSIAGYAVLAMTSSTRPGSFERGPPQS